MGPPSRTNAHRQPPPPMLPPRQRPPPGGLRPADPVLAKNLDKGKEKVGDCSDMSLLDIAKGEVDVISQRLKNLSDEFLERLKNELRLILEEADGDELLILQKLIQKRGDLTEKTLIGAHRVQLEILVAINTGMQAYLHQSIRLSQISLVRIFLFKRCRNIECQSQLPADDCNCKICANTEGFCSLCMCMSCTKFDFEGNTCRWIGCDQCSHWTHTDCAVRDGRIGMGADEKKGEGTAEMMIFRCGACGGTSEMLGWVKDIFEVCAPGWDRQGLMRELDFVTKIFRGSLDSRGRRLSWICEDVIEKIKGGMVESVACRVLMLFFQELEIESSRHKFEEIGRLAPEEACNRISEVLQEAITKMKKVEEERDRMLKKARLDLEACDRELEDKAREIMELKKERKQKKEETEKLEKMVREKEAEADSWEQKAIEAREEAEKVLQSISLSKSHKANEEQRGSGGFLQLNSFE